MKEFKADIEKGLREFVKVEKDFLKYERETKRALSVSSNAMNTRMDF